MFIFWQYEEIQTYNACFIWINGDNLQTEGKKITKWTIMK
jgi:uncharacterized protein YvpB